MKKVTAFIGSARKHGTYHAVRRFLTSLEVLGDVESEIVKLSDCRVETCRGCKNCFEKGEESCPYAGDDRTMLMDKMMASDGVVFASPVYTFQVSAIMKKFLDRLGFICHRPRFFGRAWTSLVVEAFRGGRDCVKYLDFVGLAIGFNVVPGSCVPAGLEVVPEKLQRKTDAILEAHARRFSEALSRPAYPSPTLFKLMAFRWSRTSVGRMLDETALDYRYYRDKGWFESPYYYPTHLNPVQRVAGRFFDYLGARGS